MAEMLLVERAGPAAWITINRPDVRNALSLELCDLLVETLEALGRDRAVRVIVLRGAGERVFASGADIREFRDKLATPEAALDYDARFEAVSSAIEAVPQPVVAMIHGYAVGSGCLVSMACDVRLVGDRAKLGLPVAKIGLLASVPDTGRLVSLVGPARAKWLLMTGELISAGEALAIGLVHRVVPHEELEAFTRGVAQTLGENAPLSLKAAKQIVDHCLAGTAATVRDGAPWYDEIYRSRDFQEGIDAFFAKRKPAFTGE